VIDNLRPMYDRILVRRIEDDNKTASGLFVPEDSNDKKISKGEVLRAGPGKWVDRHREPLDIEAGEVVIFGKYAGTEIDSDHVLLREEEIMATIRNEA
jgi:chaperonin GroES